MIENSETKTVLSYLQDVAFGDVREQGKTLVHSFVQFYLTLV